MQQRLRSWVEAAWGRTVDRAEPLSGGWTSTILALADAAGEQAVLRVMDRDPWRAHAPQMLPREQAMMRLLPSTVPVPVSLAVDPDGSAAGVPAHLMSRLPGDLELRRCDPDLVEDLADLLVALHGVDPGPERPRDYQSWAHPAKRVVPAWAARPDVWRAAFALLEQPPPSYDGVLLHRDFHLGNVLWQGGRVAGVVDWVEASWGPAALDVAHARTYLALLHGPDAAAALAAAYDDRRPGARTDPGYWDVMDAVGYLPDPVKVAAPWRDRGVDVPDDLARGRLESYLAGLLGAG